MATAAQFTRLPHPAPTAAADRAAVLAGTASMPSRGFILPWGKAMPG